MGMAHSMSPRTSFPRGSLPTRSPELTARRRMRSDVGRRKSVGEPVRTLLPVETIPLLDSPRQIRGLETMRRTGLSRETRPQMVLTSSSPAQRAFPLSAGELEYEVASPRTEYLRRVPLQRGPKPLKLRPHHKTQPELAILCALVSTARRLGTSRLAHGPETPMTFFGLTCQAPRCSCTAREPSGRRLLHRESIHHFACRGMGFVRGRRCLPTAFLFLARACVNNRGQGLARKTFVGNQRTPRRATPQ
jgi:hypothetical protein